MYNINIEYLPIVIINLYENITDNNIDNFKKDYLKLLINSKDNDKMIIIFDINNCKGLKLENIIKYLNFFNSIEKYNKEYVKKIYIITSDKNINLLISSIISLKISNENIPYKIFHDYDKLKKHIFDKYNKLIIVE